MLHVKRSCFKHESLNDVWSSSSVNMELEKKIKIQLMLTRRGVQYSTVMNSSHGACSSHLCLQPCKAIHNKKS